MTPLFDSPNGTCSAKTYCPAYAHEHHAVLTLEHKRWLRGEVTHFLVAEYYGKAEWCIRTTFLKWVFEFPAALPGFWDSTDPDERLYISRCVQLVRHTVTVHQLILTIRHTGNLEIHEMAGVESREKIGGDAEELQVNLLNHLVT